jgi:DNA polymerase I-like protein with 3'-5' exonuclease and polymerase domains
MDEFDMIIDDAEPVKKTVDKPVAKEPEVNTDDLVLAIPQLDALAKIDVKHIVDEMPWMKNKKFLLLHDRRSIEDFIDRMIKQGIGALDTETTGLNTRLDKNGVPYDKLVGISLALSREEACYIPIAHADKEYNVSLEFVLDQLKKLAANCTLIFHNFKYDGQVLRNYGIIIGGEIYDENMFEDTLIMAVIQDASRKANGLKILSKNILKREMMEIKGLGVKVTNDTIPAFDQVPPEKAVYYAAADAMNTFYLYEVFTDLINQQDHDRRQGPWGIYKIEKRCMFVTMEMERNYAKVDLEYLKKIKADLENRSQECVNKVHEIVGRPIDINSPKQLGTLLFDELKLKYTSKTPKEKTKSGNYETSEDVLKKIKKDHPIINYILDYRGYQKYLSTYVDNLINHSDQNNEIKFELNQTRADTGRYSATGGKGLKIDGYGKINCQNLPKSNSKDPKSVDIRRAIIAHPGFKIVSIDYSGEELRIAANLSKEEKWINEFLHGSGDLHTVTGKIIYNKNEISKEEREKAKTLNFTILYGGGPGTFAARAEITFDQAKKLIHNFFKQYKGIEKWAKTEAKICRKQGYCRTALGRRRPLTEFYNSTEIEVQKHGDRCAINGTVQGTAADIIKIALQRVSKWVREQGLQDKIKLMVPIHDEIVFEIKNDGSEEDQAAFGHYIEELSNIMIIDDVVTNLRWPVHLDVDAEYGDSLSVDHSYFEEKEELMQNSKNTNESQSQPKKESKTTNVEATATGVKEIDQISVSTTQHSTGQSMGYQFEANIRSKILGEDDLRLAKEILLSRVKEEPKEIEKAISDSPNLNVFIDKQNYFAYSISNFDTVVAKQVDTVISILETVGDIFIGPKCYIKLLTENNEVLYVSTKKVSVDAFISLCLWLNI